MEKDDGGSAYPYLEIDPANNFAPFQHGGMTLRDYFAGQALNINLPVMGGIVSHEEKIDQITRAAYLLADAMIKQREGK